jgi:hypothetical protein
MDITAATTQLATTLSSLDQSESKNNEHIRTRRIWAKHDRSVSERFSRYSEDPQNPDMQRIDVMEAKHFSDMADMEEEFIAGRIRSNARLAAVRVRYTTLLDELLALREK